MVMITVGIIAVAQTLLEFKYQAEVRAAQEILLPIRVYYFKSFFYREELVVYLFIQKHPKQRPIDLEPRLLFKTRYYF